MRKHLAWAGLIIGCLAMAPQSEAFLIDIGKGNPARKTGGLNLN
jgi:hypothetical protein